VVSGHFPSLIPRSSLFIAHCSLFTAHCSLIRALAGARRGNPFQAPIPAKRERKPRKLNGDSFFGLTLGAGAC